MAVDDAYSQSLCHFNGVDGATSITDEAGNSWTLVVCELDTAVKKFGTASLFPTSVNGYAYTPLSAGMNLAGGSFAFEFQYEFASLPVENVNTFGLFSIYNTSSNRLQFGVSQESGAYKASIYGKIAGSTVSQSWTPISITTGVMYHFMVSRDGDVWRFFLDGVQIGADYTKAGTFDFSSGNLGLLCNSGISDGGGNDGHMDEFRLSVGVPRQTTDFSPPTGEYGAEPAEVRKYPPLAALNLSGFNPQVIPVNVSFAGLLLTAYPPVIGAMNIPFAALVLSGFPPSVFAKPSMVSASLLLSAFDPAKVWSVPPGEEKSIQIIYRCYLTGAGESPVIADLELPMSSFQSTLRDGDPSYLACVVPNIVGYIDEILLRTNGEIVVKKGYRLKNGLEILEEIARVTYENIREDRGATSASGTISGHKTVDSAGVKEWPISGMSYYSLQTDGKRRLRGEVDTFLRIGDTVQYVLGGESRSFVVGQISYTVNPAQAIMEVGEV